MKGWKLHLLFAALWVTVLLEMRGQIKDHQQALIASKSQIDLWRDKEGRSRAELQTVELAMGTLKQTHKAELDSLKGDFDFKLRNLQSSTNVSTTTTQTVYLTQVDTVFYPHYVYRDKWTYIDLKFKTDVPELTYSIRDSISFIQHYKRESLFGRKVLYIDGVSYNPNTQITGIKNLRIKENPSKYSLGLQIGYSLRGIYLGVGLNYSLLEW
jgi:hypothetical protein